MKFNTLQSSCLDLKFSKTSHFSLSPYCVVVQAREKFKKKIHVENSTVCINSDVSLLHEMLPKPAKRHDRKSSASARLISETMPTATTPLNLIITKKSVESIEYPSEVFILQNASFLARVAEPLRKVNDTKIK